MTSELQKLRQLVNAIHPLSEADWALFTTYWKPYSADRKEIITRAGEQEKYLYFVVEGVQRVYALNEQNEKEATIVFTYPPSFGGIIDSLLLQQASNYYYQTLTPSTFLRMPSAELHNLMENNMAIHSLFSKGVSQALSGFMERMVEIQTYTSEQKFRKLLQRSPHILQWVPHKYIANYLGIDATNFSKLMNTVKI